MLIFFVSGGVCGVPLSYLVHLIWLMFCFAISYSNSRSYSYCVFNKLNIWKKNPFLAARIFLCKLYCYTYYRMRRITHRLTLRDYAFSYKETYYFASRRSTFFGFNALSLSDVYSSQYSCMSLRLFSRGNVPGGPYSTS